MSVKDADGIIVLGNDSVAPQNNITIKTPAVADGSVEIYRGVPGNLGQKLFSVDDAGLVPKIACAFSARQTGSQAIPALTTTPITFDTPDINIGSAWNGATFQPTIAGIYQINAVVSVATDGGLLVEVYKNGVGYKRGVQAQSVSFTGLPVSCLVYMNGTTDWLDVRGYTFSSTSTNAGISFIDGILLGAIDA